METETQDEEPNRILCNSIAAICSLRYWRPCPTLPALILALALLRVTRSPHPHHRPFCNRAGASLSAGWRGISLQGWRDVLEERIAVGLLQEGSRVTGQWERGLYCSPCTGGLGDVSRFVTTWQLLLPLLPTGADSTTPVQPRAVPPPAPQSPGSHRRLSPDSELKPALEPAMESCLLQTTLKICLTSATPNSLYVRVSPPPPTQSCCHCLAGAAPGRMVLSLGYPSPPDQRAEAHGGPGGHAEEPDGHQTQLGQAAVPLGGEHGAEELGSGEGRPQCPGSCPSLSSGMHPCPVRRQTSLSPGISIVCTRPGEPFSDPWTVRQILLPPRRP